MNEALHLTVVSPERTLVDEQVEIVTLPGEAGSFSVLKNHAPLVSILTRGDIGYRTGGEEHTLPIAGGFVEIKENEVSACVEL